MFEKPKYNPQIHHRKSIRLQGYDYSQAGLYFITICCENRACRFGKIENDKMILNDAGKIADDCWLEIPKHFPNAVLHEHIIMPNHVHGIIELTVGVENFQPLSNNSEHPINDENFQPLSNNSEHPINDENFQPLSNNSEHPINDENFQPPRNRNEFQKMIPRSIGSIVKGFKIGVTKWFHTNTEIKTVWQRNYYEHIIRNEQSFQTISNYIMNNPAKWNEDKFYYRKKMT